MVSTACGPSEASVDGVVTQTEECDVATRKYTSWVSKSELLPIYKKGKWDGV